MSLGSHLSRRRRGSHLGDCRAVSADGVFEINDRGDLQKLDIGSTSEYVLGYVERSESASERINDHCGSRATMHPLPCCVRRLA